MRNWIIAATLSLLCGLPATAGDYPDRPVKLIVPFAAGGVTDVVARVSAEFLGAKLNQAVIVENVPGAGGNTGIAQMIKAGKDGYTLGLVATGNLAINPHLFAKMPFDALKDVAPIAVSARTETQSGREEWMRPSPASHRAKPANRKTIPPLELE